ncbi:TatD family hydrolase [Nanoarchaeota archaeon]
MLVDIHAHLDHAKFKDDLNEVIERAKDAGVKSIITSGVNSSTNRIVLDIAKKYDIVSCSFGLYPIDALAAEMETRESDGFVRDVEVLDVEDELKWIKENKDKCVAIGECGLDYKWVKGREKEQKETFQKVIDFVEKIKKPIIIHSRKAEVDAVEMLESSKLKKVVLHCFNGRKHVIKRAADNGWSFSIPPIINRLQHFQLMTELVNINQLLTETDAPYLSPFPEQRNEPAFVRETIKQIARIKGMDEAEVEKNIYMNYQKMFL